MSTPAASVTVGLDVSPQASAEWEQWFLSDVRHVSLRVGGGELLPTVGGSGLLTGGALLGTVGAAQAVEPLPGLGGAYVYPAAMPATLGGYGVLIPADHLSVTDSPEVFTAPVSAPAAGRARFDYVLPPGSTSFMVRVVGSDVLRVIGAEGPAQLVLEVTLADGTLDTRTLGVRVSSVAPTGSVTHALASGYGYLAHRDLSESAATFTLTFADGSTRTEPVTRALVGVQLIEDPRAPVKVTASDRAGNQSGNLLVRVTTTGRDSDGNRTVFASWPLPAYLNARRPVLGALLAAAEAALNVGPEAAGDALSLTRASGSDLDTLAGYYGTTRAAGESDAALVARVQARFLPRKSSRSGLKVQLATAGAVGVQVADATSRYATALTLDGSWTLDGSVRLGGQPVTGALSAGQIAVTFQARPAAGWEAARVLTRRHTAAGVVSRLEYHVSTTASVGPATRADLHYRLSSSALRAPLGHISDSYFPHPLTLDGSWHLDGAETIDGIKNAP